MTRSHSDSRYVRSKAKGDALMQLQRLQPRAWPPSAPTPCATTSAKSVPGAQLTLPLLSLCVEAACVRIGYWRGDQLQLRSPRAPRLDSATCGEHEGL